MNAAVARMFMFGVAVPDGKDSKVVAPTEKDLAKIREMSAPKADNE